MTPDDRLFAEVFRSELEMKHREHPKFSVLWAYAGEQLEKEFAERVSLHIASCARCAKELHAIRAERLALAEEALRLLPDPLEQIPRRDPVWPRVQERLRRWGELLGAPKVFYRHALVYASLGGLVLLINFWMNQQPTLLGPSQRDWWALWLVVPWGILLVLHGLRAFFQKH